MLSSEMEKCLNEQISAELYSGYLYLGYAMEFAAMGLKGFCHWFKCQYKEELAHADRIAQFILDNNGRVVLRDISAVPIDWDCPCAAMKKALEHEKMITERIHLIMSEARKENAFAVEGLMSWFVKEQVEEESTIDGIIKYLEFAGDDNKNGLLFIDKKLGKRESNPCRH